MTDFRSGGPEALEDKPSKPDRVWNRIPDDIRQRVVMMTFEQPELSPRELAIRLTDTNSYYFSEFAGSLIPAAPSRQRNAGRAAFASVAGVSPAIVRLFDLLPDSRKLSRGTCVGRNLNHPTIFSKRNR